MESGIGMELSNQGIGGEREILSILKQNRMHSAEAHPLLQIFARDYEKYVETGVTPQSGYAALRQLYFGTRGRFDETIQNLYRKTFPPTPVDTSSSVLAGELGFTGLDEITSELQQMGMYRFKTRVPVPFIEDLNQVLDASSGKDRMGNRLVEDVTTQQMMKSVRVARLATDPLLVAIAQGYLGSQVILDSAQAWVSRPGEYGNEELSKGAMMYHMDKDRLAFLKVFLYLSDVDDTAGPHHFIQGTHKNIPDPLWKEGRMSDEEVYEHLPATGHRVEGPAGTLFLVDTSGLHRGSRPTERERRLFQVTFASSLFGHPYPPFAINRTSLFQLRLRARQYGPRFMDRFTNS